ncbi:PHP domain-containing protein [Candidatus Woesearchaeota archaeon]|nr:PHP domain-containing protein [Candidatus Woesearchaeota archaeon]
MRFDLHSHTKYSACGYSKPEQLLNAAKKAGLSGIAVTDHDTMKGALRVKKLNKDKDFEVITGIEVSSTVGHILCYNVSERIKSRDFHEIVDEARSQGGFVSISHPFRQYAFFKMLKVPLGDIAGKVDAIEGLNGRTFFWQNKKARMFAEKNGTPVTAGSDGHFPFEIGKVYIEAKNNLWKEIKKRKVKLHGTTLPGMIGEVMSAYPKYICLKCLRKIT